MAGNKCSCNYCVFQLTGGVNEKLVDLTNFYKDLFPEEEREEVVWDLDLNTIREVRYVAYCIILIKFEWLLFRANTNANKEDR